MTDPVVVRAFAADLKAAEESGLYEVGPAPGHDRPVRLVDTLPWHQRRFAWLLWRTPLRRLFARHFVSPYVLLVATISRRARDTVSQPPVESA